MSPSAALRRLFDASVGLAMHQQAHLLEQVGRSEWELELNAGTITFRGAERTLVSPVQLLGTEADGHWLWAWANETSNLPLRLLEAASLARQRGHEAGIPELVEASVPLTRTDGRMLGAVASVLYGGAGIFDATWPGGALVLLLTAPGLREDDATPLLRLGQRWPRIVQTVGGLISDQRAALHAYAGALRLTSTDADDGSVLLSGAEGEARVRFDGLGRTADVAAALHD